MMKRRHFLKQCTYTGGVLSAASMPFAVARFLSSEQQRSGRHSTLRPPGALSDDQAFVAACIGCGLCGEVCPVRCIQFYKRDGADQSYTPYIIPEEKACILCGKCMEVCPTESLTATSSKDIDMGIAQIDRTACYPWVDRGVCGACVAACPVGDEAINFDFANMYRPVVQQGCVGCGMCVEVCPHPSLPIRITNRHEGTVTIPAV